MRDVVHPDDCREVAEVDSNVVARVVPGGASLMGSGGRVLAMFVFVSRSL